MTFGDIIQKFISLHVQDESLTFKFMVNKQFAALYDQNPDIFLC